MNSTTAVLGRAGYAVPDMQIRQSAKSSEINGLCDRNCEGLKDLYNVIEQLAVRLAPVMHMVPESVGEKTRDNAGYSTSLGRTLGAHNDMIRGACSNLRSLADRLEI